jgi:hypothetical protein
MTSLNRRRLVAAIALLPLAVGSTHAAPALPKMTVSKDPNCGCCGAWIDYLRADGFAVEVVERADMGRIKSELGVPADLQSCHTAQIGNYVIEGHVPADSIRRLLTEQPQATGLAVPGMPASAPGMDVPGARDSYDVVLFGAAGAKRYARYQGRRRFAD